MGDLKNYLDSMQQVRSNEALMRCIESYEDTVRKLNELLKQSDYDREEVVRLANDADYLSDEITGNPLYNAYSDAKSRYEAALASRTLATGASCCGMCRQKQRKAENEP